jgi:cysteine-rich repeat protein
MKHRMSWIAVAAVWIWILGVGRATADVDASGRWVVSGEFVSDWEELTQSGTDLTSIASGGDPWVGTIDPITGEFSQSRLVDPQCGPDSRVGTVSADGRTFTGTIVVGRFFLIRCHFTANDLSGSRCGQAVLDPGEQCDDGNTYDGDGCGATCRVCDSMPRTDCRTAAKGVLLIRDSSDDARDALRWVWRQGEATTPAEFGVPAGTASWCVYAGTAGALIAGASIPAGSTTWVPIADKGYRYTDPAGVFDGLRRVVLRAGAAGRSRVRLTGEGSNLPDPTLAGGLPLPVEAQLLNGSTEACFASAYGGGDVIENDGARFKARLR